MYKVFENEEVNFEIDVNQGSFYGYMCEILDSKTISFYGLYTEADTYECGIEKHLLIKLNEELESDEPETIEGLNIYNIESMELTD